MLFVADYLLDPYDACLDWWALGVMVFTMLTGMVCILCDFVLNTKNDEIEHRMRQGVARCWN